MRDTRREEKVRNGSVPPCQVGLDAREGRNTQAPGISPTNSPDIPAFRLFSLAFSPWGGGNCLDLEGVRLGKLAG